MTDGQLGDDMPCDRVAEVYLGQTGGAVQQTKTRTRIDWMVAKRHGETALDIGCSQGILTLRLAQEGMRVTGTDINPRAIAYAKKLLADEPPAVRERVRLMEADALKDLPCEGFATVYLGEVLEHLETPRTLIDRAAERTSPGGRLVITTPHGHQPHDDHRQTFTLSGLMDLIPGAMSVEDVEVSDGYIRLLCRHAGTTGQRPSAEQLLELAERSLVDQQMLLHRIIRGRTSTLRRERQDARKLEERAATLERELTDQARELKAARLDLEMARGELHRIYRSRTYRACREAARVVREPGASLARLPSRMMWLARGSRLGRAARTALRQNGIVRQPKGGVFAPFKPLKTEGAPGLPVVAIMDEFTESCFRYEWNLTLLDRTGWKEQIAKARPAFLFVESAWRGNGGAWSYTLTKFSREKGHPLFDLLEHCRSISLPTVYWGKEDPPNFETFQAAAAEFDHIFTSDANCIPRYRKICGHDRVHALPFAAQPVLHNPAGRRNSPDREVAFGGGWYAEKHSARRSYLPQLLDATLEAGLKLAIFDRFSDLAGAARDKHRFPDTYQPHLKPKLTYDRMLSAYRAFPVFLNVNSVTDSPTMFSRRVFELLACGTNVVSSPSTGMTEMLPDVVSVVAEKGEAREALETLHADPLAARRRAHLGYRKVMREHTYAVRADAVARKVLAGSPPPPREEPAVSVVLATNRPERLALALENYRRQRHARKELVLVLNSDRFDRRAVEAATDDLDGIKILRVPEAKTLAACLNLAIECADGRYWAKFDDDDLYGAEYLSDALLPFAFTDAAVVGKGTYFARLDDDPALYLRREGHEHRYTRLICGGTLVVEREATRDVSFPEDIPRGADTAFLRRVLQADHRIYSADPYNFVQMRLVDHASHTWKIKREDYLRSCRRIVESGGDEHVFL